MPELDFRDAAAAGYDRAVSNARGVATARGGAWHPMTVRNMLARGVGR